jgi:hypothetical protein
MIAFLANDRTGAALYLLVVVHGLSLHKLLMASVLLSRDSSLFHQLVSLDENTRN